MLQGRRPLPTIPAKDLDRARAWYADKLYRSGSDRLFLLLPPPAPGPPSISWPPGQLRTWRPRWPSCAAGGWCSRTTTSRASQVDGVATTRSAGRPGSKTARTTPSP